MSDAAVTTESIKLSLAVPGTLDEKAIARVLASHEITLDEVKRVANAF